MPDQPTDRLAQLLDDDAVIQAALDAGVREAILRHKLAGNPIAAVEDGKVVWIPADSIEVPPAAAAAA